MTCLITLLNIGSTTVLNAGVSLGVVSRLTAFWIAIACLIYLRLIGEALRARRWSLGRAGLILNLAALAFLTPICLCGFWPSVVPVTAKMMNWAAVMYVGLMGWAFIYYLIWGRRTYTEPMVLVSRSEE